MEPIPAQAAPQACQGPLPQLLMPDGDDVAVRLCAAGAYSLLLCRQWAAHSLCDAPGCGKLSPAMAGHVDAGLCMPIITGMKDR